MRTTAKLLLVLAVGAASLASCLLDREGLRSAPIGMAMGGGGAMSTTTATATASGSTTATSTSASGSGGTGGVESICGNHLVEGVEQCDDGNTVGDDGCSEECTIEPLETCPGLPIQLTTTRTLTGTLVGRSNDLLPSCAPSLLDVVYEVTPTVTGTLVAKLTAKDEKSVSLRTTCGDGPTSEIACTAGTGDVAVSRWVYAGVKYYVVVDAGADIFKLQLTLSACGDGAAQGLEECDDPADSKCVGCFRCTGKDEVFDGVSRHCYRVFTGNAKDWKGARDDCLEWGGDLVGVSSAAESDFLKAHFNDVWTGATDQVDECQFQWVNGEPWQPHWENNEPNNGGGNNQDCGLFFDSGNMDDRSCDEHHDAVCERAPGGSCGDNIVQPGEECDDAISSMGFTCAGCVVQCPVGQIKDLETHHCYEIVTTMNVGWDAAQAACATKGAYLAAINSAAENGLLQPSVTVPLWVGGKRGDPFRWLNTDPSCYFLNWAAGEPSQAGGFDCATMQLNGTWTTELCTLNQGYVCEHDN